MSSPDKSPPSDFVRKPDHPWRFIWHQIVFVLRLCLICIAAFFLLAVLNVVILSARQSIECPNDFPPPDATFPDKTTRDMFYRTTNLTTFLADDVRGVVRLSGSLNTLSRNRTLLAIEQAIADVERLSDGLDEDFLGDLVGAWYRLGSNARDLFSHMVALHGTGFYAMRSFALQLRHIDLALDKLHKSWTSWDYAGLHAQMRTSCGVLKAQLARLDEELDRVHTVVDTSRNAAAAIKQAIQDKHTALILKGLELKHFHKIWYTLDNLTVANLDFRLVVDRLDRDLRFVERPIPFGICDEENLTLLEDGGVQHPSTYYGSREGLWGYAETLEEYGDFDAVQRNDVVRRNAGAQDLAGQIAPTGNCHHKFQSARACGDRETLLTSKVTPVITG
ncbi:hypothetical protein F5146DRAFT_1230757 [Armillaria mellea]|nr:hypothetical protein F5146DRAFT_1230757 [Armillaria mellea]